jgi:hypothetical protein
MTWLLKDFPENSRRQLFRNGRPAALQFHHEVFDFFDKVVVFHFFEFTLIQKASAADVARFVPNVRVLDVHHAEHGPIAFGTLEFGVPIAFCVWLSGVNSFRIFLGAQLVQLKFIKPQTAAFCAAVNLLLPDPHSLHA